MIIMSSKSNASELPVDPAEYDRVIRPQRGLAALNLPELWRYRELFVFLAWRDILLRYKQTYLRHMSPGRCCSPS